jgi:hypothetical protein
MLNYVKLWCSYLYNFYTNVYNSRESMSKVECFWKAKLKSIVFSLNPNQRNDLI